MHKNFHGRLQHARSTLGRNGERRELCRGRDIGEFLTQCNRPANGLSFYFRENGPKMTAFRLWPENGTPYEKFTGTKIDGLRLCYRPVSTLTPYIHKLTRQGALGASRTKFHSKTPDFFRSVESTLDVLWTCTVRKKSRRHGRRIRGSNLKIQKFRKKLPQNWGEG